MTRTPHRPISGSLAILAMIMLLGAACSVTPSIDVPGSALDLDAVPANAADADTSTQADQDVVGDKPPAALAFIDEPIAAEPSAEFCTTSANIWIHSAALNMITHGNAEMNQIALLNVAEWLERSTLFTDEETNDARISMFEAFSELQTTVESDFDFDWQSFQVSTAYANDPAAQTYETERTALVTFISEGCDGLSVAGLRGDATARAADLEAEFSAPPSTVAESDALPGHSIFTHSSGTLIASFPTAWSYEEGRGDAFVDLAASPDIDRFLAGDAIDGVHLQLVDAATLADFRSQIDATMTGTTCLRTADVSDSGSTRLNITQTFECPDHGASIIGQYREATGTGLIIEASFDRVEASRADLVRLSSIANSALWS